MARLVSFHGPIAPQPSPAPLERQPKNGVYNGPANVRVLTPGEFGERDIYVPKKLSPSTVRGLLMAHEAVRIKGRNGFWCGSCHSELPRDRFAYGEKHRGGICKGCKKRSPPPAQIAGRAR